MNKGLAFWLIMLVWIIFGLLPGGRWRGSTNQSFVVGGDIVIFILLFLLGWGLYGFILH